MRRPDIKAIFPHLAKFKWGEINIDECAKRSPGRQWDGTLNGRTFQLWLRSIQDQAGIDFSYGGYGEDRSTVWNGRYMLPHNPIHLGVDFNVLEGNVVLSPFAGRVVEAWDDTDQDGGWGGRVVIETGDSEYIIFAHLDPDSLTDQKWIVRGSFVGLVGGVGNNGGWYPHLHVQKVVGKDYREADGYGTLEDLKHCPNPFG